MTSINRRLLLQAPLGAAVACVVGLEPARGAVADRRVRSFQLDNGFRTHVLEGDFGYTSLVLSLRSREIMDDGGLAHIMEHTSFVGAAGHLSAREIDNAWKDYVQDSNAYTSPGEICWQASFLPEHLPEVIELLALTSLDQKFDLPTVEQERQVVLEELFADKYDAKQSGQRAFDRALYGKRHPAARDTVDEEIATAQQPADVLAQRLKQHARLLRLPANMNLFVIGEAAGRGRAVQDLVRRHFGRFDRRGGPVLDVPVVPETSRYRELTQRARDIRAPLSELQIGWNTCVTLHHRDAAAVALLTDHLNDVLFTTIREEQGASYALEATFTATPYAGIVEIVLQTTRPVQQVELALLNTVESLKRGVREESLGRLRARLELARRRKRRQDDVLLEIMADRTVHGISSSDLDTQQVTAELATAAARKYLPSYRGGYVRLVRIGRGAKA